MKDKNSIRKIEDTVVKAFNASGVKNLLVAVSGGADSVALLCACSRVAARLGLRLEAANCNFHLRDTESDRDSAFTEALCENLGIKLHRLKYNVDNYMEEHPGISIEMACRELRYTDFFRICRENGLDRVAVAHNSDDDIETMVMNLLRGSGSRGMRGMDADNGRVIRPLLGVSRSEIESFLESINQDFITDSSNLSSHYRRNFIRRDVLPLLESRWPGARKSLSRTLSIMKEESEIVDAHYRNILALLSPDPRTLLVYAKGVTPGLIFRFIEPFGGNSSIAQEIAEALSRDFRARSWTLSDVHTSVLERDSLIIVDSEAASAEPSLVWEKLELTSELMEEILNNRSLNIIYLPDDESSYELRRPRLGDRMSPLGMRGTRLVSDIISDARLDSVSKQGVRVLSRRSDGEIVWVTTLKRSRLDLVSRDMDYLYRATLHY